MPGLVVLIPMCVLFAVFTGYVAAAKGRSRLLWAVLGALFPVYALIVVAVMPSKATPEEATALALAPIPQTCLPVPSPTDLARRADHPDSGCVPAFVGRIGGDTSFLILAQRYPGLDEGGSTTYAILAELFGGERAEVEWRKNSMQLHNCPSERTTSHWAIEAHPAKRRKNRYAGTYVHRDHKGRQTKQKCEFQPLPVQPSKGTLNKVQPIFEADEMLLQTLEGAFRGKWSRTLITTKGIYISRGSKLSFIPFEDITGIYEEYDHRRDLISLYRGRTLLHRLKVSGKLDLLVYIKRAALTGQANKAPAAKSGKADGLDRLSLLEVVLRNRRSVRGSRLDPLFMAGYYKTRPSFFRLSRQGLKDIEEYLGEPCLALLGGTRVLTRGCFVNPAFVFPNWVVSVVDEIEGETKTAVSAVYRPDIAFWFSFCLYKHETHTTYSSERTAGGNTTYSRVLCPANSWLILATPYSEYRLHGVALSAKALLRQSLGTHPSNIFSM